LAAAALAACSTTLDLSGGSSTPATEDAEAQATSPANIASLTEVVQRNPNDAQAYNMRGSVLGRAGRHQEALADFDRAIGIDANYAQAYANRGQVHRQMGKHDLALADYNKAIALDQNYALAYLGRGQVYRAQGRALDALNDFNRAIQMSPGNGTDVLPARACCIRRRRSTNSRSTISPPRSG
jgi:tetratricopeptide (TPR) repeat protein